MFPSSVLSSAPGGGNTASNTTAPHLHVHAVVINVGDADATAVGSNAGMADAFSAIPAMVSAVMTTSMELSDVAGLGDILDEATPASTAAREWRAHSCPPFSPEEVIATMDLVQTLTASPATGTASTNHAETGGANAIVSSSPSAPEVKDCPICLEPLFRTSAVITTTENGDSVTNATPPHSERFTADLEKPSTASQSPPLQAQVPSSSPSVPPLDSAASSDVTRSLAHNDKAKATKSTSRVREVYCGHRFHESCILQWLTLGHYSCPLCRSPFVFE
ncbi:hypothetical protein, conserved [Leishmania tarentolae]|uniref:RING-type domain-containing protein n=1 Tax=Leishmania tarentolae TaxID=5689 RepID=A0A640KLR5_LEITA|nr:hypothetical protein, conserved [Leishmania tarentolae]